MYEVYRNINFNSLWDTLLVQDKSVDKKFDKGEWWNLYGLLYSNAPKIKLRFIAMYVRIQVYYVCSERIFENKNII